MPRSEKAMPSSGSYAPEQILRDQILAGRGLAYVGVAGSEAYHAFLEAAAEAGRADDVVTIDLSGDTWLQGRSSRFGLRVPDLDALATDPAFVDDMVVALRDSYAFHTPADRVPEWGPSEYAAVVAACAAEPGGAGAWDRIVETLSAGGPDGRQPHPALAFASRAALLKAEAIPGLDGVTPALDLDRALGAGLTLVLADRSDGNRDRPYLDRAFIVTALARLLADRVRPGGAGVILDSRQAGMSTRHWRPRSPTASGQGAHVQGLGLAYLPEGFPPAPGRPSSLMDPRQGGDRASGPFGRAVARTVGWDTFVVSVDRYGWPSYNKGQLKSHATVGGLARQVVDGACRPHLVAPANEGARFTGLGMRALKGWAIPRSDPPWPGADADPVLDGVDTPLALACETAKGGSLLHAWVRAGDFGRRRQFVMTFLALADLGRTEGFGEAIDAGQAALPLMAASLGISESRMRRLVGLADGPGADWRPLVGLAERLPIEFLPGAGDQAGWRMFREVASLGLYVLWDDRSAPAMSHLLGFMARCGKAGWAKAHGGPQLKSWRMLRDTVAALSVFCDDIVTGAGSQVARSIVFDNRGMDGLVAMTELWHDDPVLRLGGSRDLDPSAAWTPLFDGDVELGGGYVARSLGSLAALVDEGGAGPDVDGVPGLDHCVAGYARACMAREIAIVSVRNVSDGAVRRVSTAEIRLRGGEPRLVQHRGHRNAQPMDTARDAVDRLMDMVLSGSLRKGANQGEALGAPGRGACDIAELDDVVRRWSRVLPKAWRHADHAGFSEAVIERADALGLGRPAPAPGP